MDFSISKCIIFSDIFPLFEGTEQILDNILVKLKS